MLLLQSICPKEVVGRMRGPASFLANHHWMGDAHQKISEARIIERVLDETQWCFGEGARRPPLFDGGLRTPIFLSIVQCED